TNRRVAAAYATGMLPTARRGAELQESVEVERKPRGGDLVPEPADQVIVPPPASDLRAHCVHIDVEDQASVILHPADLSHVTQAPLYGFRHAGPAKERIEEGALPEGDREGRDSQATEALRRHHDRLDIGRCALGPDQLETDLEDLAVAACVLRLVAKDIDAVT